MAFTQGEFRAFVRTEGRGVPMPATTVVRDHFMRFGTVMDVYRPANSVDLCYVTFNTADELAAALMEAQPVLGDIPCNVQQAAPRGSTAGGGYTGGYSTYSTAYAATAAYAGVPAAATSPGLPPQQPQQPPPQQQIIAYQSTVDSNRVYVTGLVAGVDEVILAEYFGFFGAVKDVYIPIDKETGLRKPFAFVTMTSPEEVLPILEAPMHDLGGGVTVNVTVAERRDAGKGAPYSPGAYAAGKGAGNGFQATPRAVRPSGVAAGGGKEWQDMLVPGGKGNPIISPKQGVPGNHRLFVFGMPEGLNADMLRGHFARHGEILDIYIPVHNRDIAYITFSTEEEVQDAAINSGLRIAGYYVKGVKLAESRRKGEAKGGRVQPYGAE